MDAKLEISVPETDLHQSSWTVWLEIQKVVHRMCCLVYVSNHSRARVLHASEELLSVTSHVFVNGATSVTSLGFLLCKPLIFTCNWLKIEFSRGSFKVLKQE